MLGRQIPYLNNNLALQGEVVDFYVLYNGTALCPDEAVVKLSDLFKSVEPLGLTEKTNPVLELEVKVLNINEGNNETIVHRCRHLAQYSAFVAKVREIKNEGYNLQEAIKKAVVYCRDHDILKELLEKNASEVLNMLMTEWNLDDALAVRFEEGQEKRNEEIVQNALDKGYSPETIHAVTGIGMENIEELAKR